MHRWAIWGLSATAIGLLTAMLVVHRVRNNRVLASEPEPQRSASTTTSNGSSAAQQGEFAARADLAAGVLGWKESGGYGLPAPRTFDEVSMGDILAQDFGVRLTRTPHGGCMAPSGADDESQSFSAYNAVMKPAIIAKHGPDVFEVAMTRAKAENERRADHYNRELRKPNESPDAMPSGHANPRVDAKCDPPFYVDQKTGIRRIKPGCM